MLGYNVFYHVSGSKKSYSSTEFYESESDANSRALELSFSSNIDVIGITKINFEYCGFNVIKGKSKFMLEIPDLIPRKDKSYNEAIMEYFKDATIKK